MREPPPLLLGVHATLFTRPVGIAVYLSGNHKHSSLSAYPKVNLPAPPRKIQNFKKKRKYSCCDVTTSGSSAHESVTCFCCPGVRLMCRGGRNYAQQGSRTRAIPFPVRRQCGERCDVLQYAESQHETIAEGPNSKGSIAMPYMAWQREQWRCRKQRWRWNRLVELLYYISLWSNQLLL